MGDATNGRYPLVLSVRRCLASRPLSVQRTMMIVKVDEERKLVLKVRVKISAASTRPGHLDLLKQDAKKPIKANEPIIPYS